MRKKFPSLLLSLILPVLLVCGISVNDRGEKKESGKVKREGGMSGIVFFKTKKLQELKDFYIDKIGCKMWMDQGDCVILKFGNMLFGFCQKDKADLDALITFFYEDKKDVDRAYARFKDVAESPPVMNKNYPIYNFFAVDPEGRAIEFQFFTVPIDWDFKHYK